MKGYGDRITLHPFPEAHPEKPWRRKGFIWSFWQGLRRDPPPKPFIIFTLHGVPLVRMQRDSAPLATEVV
jgi:hypothetical protein